MSVKNSFFFKSVKNNKRYKRLIEMREKGMFAVDHERAIKEIESLHLTRNMRTLTVKTLLSSFQHSAIDITLQNSAFRSRVVEIKMKFFKLNRALERHLAKMRNYLASRYASQLKTEFSTMESRKKALDYLLEDFNSISNNFTVVVELADFVIDDIDKAGWSVKAIIEAMAIAAKDK